ncbi:Flavinator of succinate dehydrogenase-domain-containing protein [Xylaria palmicola]|nr:Flavinator of succinate dehydrogenase-domain-containing protein [Xylaria palmicola]
MASLPRSLLRPARRARALARCPSASPARAPRVVSLAAAARGMASVGNAPPMEPHKERPRGEMAVGELEGAAFTIEPLRRVGEDDKTMRARLVYQSRKRGILETDLLLSTFADQYLPAMTRAEMGEYDLFLDENDWDIYYWATQDETQPSSSSSASASSAAASTSATADSSDAAYDGGSVDAATAGSGSGSGGSAAGESASTGGLPLSGEHVDAKAQASSSSSAQQTPPTPYAGEWAQTVGTFKPAYRPVPARWRDSAILGLVREHVRARAGEKGGMAFMPALRS